LAKERALRRAAREAEAARARADAERREARRRQRRALVRRLRPRSRRTGKAFVRRSSGERAGIVIVTLFALGLVWFVLDDVALRLVLTLLIVIGLPALVVAVLGRRT
jgi:hypothetical protein